MDTLESEGTVKELQMQAYAKINLGLDVIRRLENGYHQVKMIMQTVGIYDELNFQRIPTVIVLTTNHGKLPLDENNLIYKAVRLMQEAYGISGGVKVHLLTNIPVAAGMAGGSTDAAATLRAMNQLFDLQVSDDELKVLGVKIGADVPYCIMGGTALAEGIGEKLTALPKAPDCQLLVAKPDINVSTKYVYEHLDANKGYEHPDIDGMVEAIEAGSLEGITNRMGNVLESVTIPANPVIADIKRRMLQLGAANSLMSGSGPTVFGIFTDRETAAGAYRQMKQEQPAAQVFLTHFV